MKYSLATVGLKVRVHFTKWVHLNLNVGYTVFRYFSYWDGPNEASTYDMENTFYLRAEDEQSGSRLTDLCDPEQGQ